MQNTTESFGISYNVFIYAYMTLSYLRIYDPILFLAHEQKQQASGQLISSLLIIYKSMNWKLRTKVISSSTQCRT